MTFTDTAITVLVLIGLFLMGYSAIRKQGIGETIRELRDSIRDKSEEAKDKMNLKYA